MSPATVCVVHKTIGKVEDDIFFAMPQNIFYDEITTWLITNICDHRLHKNKPRNLLSTFFSVWALMPTPEHKKQRPGVLPSEEQRKSCAMRILPTFPWVFSTIASRNVQGFEYVLFCACLLWCYRQRIIWAGKNHLHQYRETYAKNAWDEKTSLLSTMW